MLTALTSIIFLSVFIGTSLGQGYGLSQQVKGCLEALNEMENPNSQIPECQGIDWTALTPADQELKVEYIEELANRKAQTYQGELSQQVKNCLNVLAIPDNKTPASDVPECKWIDWGSLLEAQGDLVSQYMRANAFSGK